MPKSDPSVASNAAVPLPGLSTSEGVPAQDEGAVRRFMPRWGVESPGQQPPAVVSRQSSYGDLLQGSIAVMSLLLMVAIGTTLWLAVPLAAVTYVAVGLLRPTPTVGEESVQSSDRGDPGPKATDPEAGPEPVPGEVLTGADIVATRYGLTRRERQILPLLAERLTDREIADRLSISHRTAMNHTANILGKLGLESRRDVAALIARHAGLPAPVLPHKPE